MHLWPSMRLRDSFKINYLKNLEHNLHRMNIQKHRNQSDVNHQKLLEDDQAASENKGRLGFCLICRELIMVLSCCFCCFCCGACVGDEESS